MDLNSPINDLDGKPLETGLTLRKVCVNALMASYPGDERLEGGKKLERYMLAQRIHASDAALKAEDVTLIKSLVGMGYGPAVVGPVFLLLDPACSGS